MNMEYFDLLDSREYALVIWIIVIFFICILFKKNRNNLLRALKNLINKTLFYLFATLFLYLTAVLFFLSNVGLWNVNLIPETVVWFFGIAIITLLNIQQLSDDSDFFKKIIIKNINPNLIFVIGFLINIQTFPLYIELILLPLSTIYLFFLLLSKNKKLINCVTNIFGFFLIIYALYNAFANYQNFEILTQLHWFVLPVLLTVMYLPFLYVTSLFAYYQKIFMNIDKFIEKNKYLRFAIKRKILLFCNLNLWKVIKLLKNNALQLSDKKWDVDDLKFKKNLIDRRVNEIFEELT